MPPRDWSPTRVPFTKGNFRKNAVPSLLDYKRRRRSVLLRLLETRKEEEEELPS